MYGAILGDIIGSPYEFAHWERNKNFELFSKYASFTDDTVMTVAIAESLLKCGKESEEITYEEVFVESMQKWGLEYIDAGYGGLFYRWLLSKQPQPYGSFGNGLDSHKTNSVEHIFKEAMRNYHDNNDSRKVYAVCWYAYLNNNLE